ncbi:zinc knuckle [Labeo rohita]|uniref:Zinc knuckle n=1 Tax=Labeo rohita TaxID=84645 RepID=A0A498M4K1_LABRO|nr:zinc knuckle [Labeo rohita]
MQLIKSGNSRDGQSYQKPAPVTAKLNTVKITLKNVWQKGQKIEIEALETPQVCAAVMKIPACVQVQVSEDALVSQHPKAFWEIESLGITMKRTENPEEEEALLQFEKTTQYKDGRYKVELPWRPDKPELPDDYRTAKKRFDGFKRKLRSDLVLCH